MLRLVIGEVIVDSKRVGGQVWISIYYLEPDIAKCVVACGVQVQQPATGKVKTVPHSSPGRFQFEPRCSLGPCEGGTFMPDGPRATMLKVPEPVILQTIFTSKFASGGTPEAERRRPHNSAVAAVPCTSGPTEELSIGDAGWQCFRPGALGPVIVCEGTGVGLCAAGRTGLGELVEHAVNSVRSRKKQ
jgi:hypothetical protein